ncbi:50S ribosome-binding GTPase [Candidatus Woesearchaeota archaeon]|nr:50S ribosome-binding GTPase [Candidatus Woesearchaeota archaeon]
MPINAHPEYFKAEEDYRKATSSEAKLAGLKKMLSLSPTHKGSEVLRSEIKTKIAKLKQQQEKEKTSKTGSKSKFSIKKEGDSRVCIIGFTNTGKSTLLSKLTNAKPEIAEYKFTTKEPEVGIMDYKGIKLQVIETPALTDNIFETENGPSIISLIKTADLLILCLKDNQTKNQEIKEKENLIRLLKLLEIKNHFIYNYESTPNMIWKNLDIIKVYTKHPGKEKAFPPIAIKRGTTVGNLADYVHKDFKKNFKYARIWGSSAKFDSQQVGLNHVLKDDDIIEFHIK